MYMVNADETRLLQTFNNNRLTVQQANRKRPFVVDK